MKYLPVLTCLLAFTVILRADIAPTVFTGTNVFPLQSAEVRMAAADVRIVWGEPCSLTADFKMINESDRDVELEVGFPVGAFHPYDSRKQQLEAELGMEPAPLLEEVGEKAVAITVNGAATPAFRRVPPEKIHEIKWRYASWYFAKIVFRPGANTVTVTTRLNPSGVYAQPFKRRLCYCISTGARWKGSIGRETVEISFPGFEVSSLIGSVTPKTGIAARSAIRWEFDNFEPQAEEYDIDLEFLAPSVAAKLAEIRQAYERAPRDTNAALRYAVHLFVLGAGKGNAGFPPEALSTTAYQKILEAIRSPEDRTVFARHYLPTKDGYTSESSERTPDRKKMVRILADAGYCDDYPEVARVQEGRAVVERVLEREPKNAAAWNVYLAHFWRFSFAARGHWFGPSVFSKPLCEAIQRAYQNCPGDPDIRAWHQAMQKDGVPPTYSTDFRRKPVAFQCEYEAGPPAPDK